jgi:hypothetical protein
MAGSSSGDRIELSGSTDVTTAGDAELPIIRQLVAILDCDRVDLRVEVESVETTTGVSARPPA